jgi:TetR/AcrR family fatty acid metabolism transcriptional regulator
MMQLYPKQRKVSVMPKDYRGKILGSAIKVFAQKGYANTTMSDIANHAKVGIGTLYNYFKNKDDLLMQCMKKTIEDEIDQIRLDTVSIDDPSEKMHYFLNKHLELINSKPYIGRFLLIEIRQSESFYKKHPTYNPMNYYLNFFRSVFHEGMDRKLIRQIDVDAMSLSIVGTIDMILTQWMINGRTTDVKQLWDNYRDIIRRGIELK